MRPPPNAISICALPLAPEQLFHGDLAGALAKIADACYGLIDIFLPTVDFGPDFGDGADFTHNYDQSI